MKVNDMDILSAIITIAIWAFIGTAIKRNAKGKKDASVPRRPGQPPVTAAKSISSAAKSAVPAAPSAKDQDAAPKEAKARFEKVKRAYTPVTVPKQEGEGTDVSRKGHVVQPASVPGAHVHEETSLTGFKPCPGEKAPARKEPAPAEKNVPASVPAPEPSFSFAFTREEALRAIVYSEILGKPKALR